MKRRVDHRSNTMARWLLDFDKDLEKVEKELQEAKDKYNAADEENKILIIALPVSLAVVLIALVLACVCCYKRGYKKGKKKGDKRILLQQPLYDHDVVRYGSHSMGYHGSQYAPPHLGSHRIRQGYFEAGINGEVSGNVPSVVVTAEPPSRVPSNPGVPSA